MPDFYNGPLEPYEWVAAAEAEFQRERKSIAIITNESGRRKEAERAFLDSIFGPSEPVKRKTVYTGGEK